MCQRVMLCEEAGSSHSRADSTERIPTGQGPNSPEASEKRPGSPLLQSILRGTHWGKDELDGLCGVANVWGRP